MISLGFVGRQLGAREDRAEKQPGAEFARDQIGVLALPADPGGLGERLFHHRGGIDEDFDLQAGLATEPAGEGLELAFDDAVIVAALRVNGDCAALGAL